jgi:glycosyltransferase involved in cell wall biosynthesis
MRILVEHNGVLPVRAYGGTERVLFWLMKELVKKGHEVFLIADPASRVTEFGIKLIPRTIQGQDFRSLIPKGIDVIQVAYTPPDHLKFDCPVVVNIGGIGRKGEIFHPNTVFVSQKHAEIHGAKSFVYNGLDFSEYPFFPKKTQDWKDFLFLAKGSWKVKNLRDCIRACRKTSKHLHIAGGRTWWPSRYLHSYGMVSQEEKLPLLRKVDALLWPVRWHEPFGIAIIEAFSQGIPVVASPYGSLRELVTNESGILCENFEKFVKVIGEGGRKFDPEAIRAHAEKFNSSRMADGYVRCYEKVLRGEGLNASPPMYCLEKVAEDLLPF